MKLSRFNEYELIIESSKKRGNSNIIINLCVSMLLINPKFLDKLLDMGIKGRYTEDSTVFMNDLKNMLFMDNRFKLGIFNDDNICVTDTDDERVKIQAEFSKYEEEFSVEKDWNKLIKARKIANNIREKLLITEHLLPSEIKYVYWLGINRTDIFDMDIIIELNDNRQFPIYINKSITSSKTQSFNTFSDILIGSDIDNLYSETYMPKWNKLVQEFIKTIYENANSETQLFIDKFISYDRIPSITYFNYYDIKHSNKDYQHLGEYFKLLNKNYLNLYELLGDVYKCEECFDIDKYQAMIDKWTETKHFILYSKIIEHLFSESFKNLMSEDNVREGDYIIADKHVKMRLIKLLVELLNVNDTISYYFYNSGNDFVYMPNREFFRNMFDKITIKYDYHVDLTDLNLVDDKDSNFIIRYDIDNEPIAKLNIDYTFSSFEMNSNLSVKKDLQLNTNFNNIINSFNISK